MTKLDDEGSRMDFNRNKFVDKTMRLDKNSMANISSIKGISHASTTAQATDDHRHQSLQRNSFGTISLNQVSAATLVQEEGLTHRPGLGRSYFDESVKRPRSSHLSKVKVVDDNTG